MSIKSILITLLVLVCLRLAFCGGPASVNDSIEMVAFDRIRGKVTAVFLFEDGMACTDTAVVWFDSPEEHREQYPNTWRPWRRENGKVQLKWGEQWENVTWNNDHAEPLPEGYRFSGTFTKLGGHGKVYTSKSYTFYQDGTFNIGSSVSVSHTNHLSGANTGFYSLPEDRRGRYHIDQFQLHLEFDNGDKAGKTIVMSHYEIKKPEVIYLNGTDFVQL